MYRHFGYISNVLIGEVGAGTTLNVPQLLFRCKPKDTVICRTHALVTYIPFEAMHKIIIKYQETKQKLENFVLQNPYDLERDYFIEIIQRSIEFFKRLDYMAMRKIYMESQHVYFEQYKVIFNVGDVCEYIYIIMFGNVEIGLFNGVHYMTMDQLGRGSVLGFTGVVMLTEQVYVAKVKSPRAKLIKIPRHIILKQMKNYPKLKEDYLECEEHLIFNSPPTIDYIIRYDQDDDDPLQKVIANFKKQNLWENGALNLIRFSDVVFKKHYEEIRSFYQVGDAVKCQEILCNIMFGAKGRNIGLAKFNRGFRRLLKIIRFAKMIGDEIDPYFIDIGAHTLFHVRGRQL